MICGPRAIISPASPIATSFPWSSTHFISDNPAFVDLLVAEHAAELVVRNGLVCVPWDVVNHYTTPGASPLDWELDPRDIPMHGPV
jgi:hypothetical protein